MSYDTPSPASDNTDLTELSGAAKARVLADFWVDRYSAIVNYSSRLGSNEGFWVDKKLTYSTNRGMFYLFMIVVLSFYPLHFLLHDVFGVESSAKHNLLHLGLFLGPAIVGLLLVFFGRRVCSTIFARGVKKGDRNHFREVLSRSEYQSVLAEGQVENDASDPQTGPNWKGAVRSFFFRRWLDFTFFTPFSYKFIWWWTLIAGIAMAEIDYFAQMYSEPVQPGDPPARPTGFNLSFMRAVIISVIAYIATNIIRELLLLREHYVKGVQKVEKGWDTAKALSGQLTFLSESVVPKAVDTITTSLTRNRINDLLNSLSETNKEQSDSVRNQSKRFQELIEGQIANFIKQTKIEDDETRQWLLSTLNRYISTQTEILNTDEKRLITLFSKLGKMVEEIVDVTYPGNELITPGDGIEFFALLVIPPEKFLNYTNYSSSARGKNSIGDRYWEEYLEGNINSCKRGIRQVRHFLSIKKNAGAAFGIDSEEAVEVRHSEVKEQLNMYVELEDGFPRKIENEDGAKKYHIEEKPEATGEWMQLARVLDTLYHGKDCCFVREVDEDDYEDLLTDKKLKKVERHNEKPIDYFAIRKGDQWKFCLQTRYDKSFDIAEIEILYEGIEGEKMRDKWKRVKDTLETVFVNETRRGDIIPMRKFYLEEGNNHGQGQ